MTETYARLAQHPAAPTIQTYYQMGAGPFHRLMTARCWSCGTFRTAELAHSEDWETRATSEAAALYAEGHAVCTPWPCGCHYSLNLDLPILCDRHRRSPAVRTPESDEGSTSLLLLSALVPVLLAVVFLARLLAEVSAVTAGLR